MTEEHRIWIAQCDAARDPREETGVDSALGYLIGEKLVNFLRAADDRPDYAAEVPSFVAEIRDIFDIRAARAALVS